MKNNLNKFSEEIISQYKKETGKGSKYVTNFERWLIRRLYHSKKKERVVHDTPIEPFAITIKNEEPSPSVVSVRFRGMPSDEEISTKIRRILSKNEPAESLVAQCTHYINNLIGKTAIHMPTDADIDDEAKNSGCDVGEYTGRVKGAKWLRSRILTQLMESKN